MKAIALVAVCLLLLASPADACIDTLKELVPCWAPCTHPTQPALGGVLDVRPEGPVLWNGNDGVSGPAVWEEASCGYRLPDGSVLRFYVNGTWDRTWNGTPPPQPGIFEQFLY